MQRFRKTMKRKRNRIFQINKSPLASTQGVVYLPKGTQLYHVSTTLLCDLPKKPMLFMTYHPSEQWYEDAYISVVELQKEVRLLFMIKEIRNLRIDSALNELLENTNTNLAKMKHDKIKEWIPFLKKEGFDGWLSSVENKPMIEIAICMDPNILKIINCSPIEFNWKNSTQRKEKIVPKNWGSVYPLPLGPFKLILNKRFKPQIENYQKQINEEDPMGTAFSILLENAEIIYIDKPIQTISWVSQV